MLVNSQQRAYAHIYNKLANSELLPGTRLSNRSLAKEIGVSVIPVREAMNQLASKGLLTQQPGLGTFVPELNEGEYLELLDLREALECHAVSKVCGRLTAADLAELEKNNAVLTVIIDELKQTGLARDAAQIERWNVADAAFHMTILRAAGNQRSLDIVRELRLMSRIFAGRLDPRPIETLVSTRDDHDRIIAALRRGDPREASDMMARHIRARWLTMVCLFDQTKRDNMSPVDAVPSGMVNRVIEERLRAMEERRSPAH